MAGKSQTVTLLAVAILAAAMLITLTANSRSDATGADAGTIALGQRLYDAQCASCHGADLQGQPDWKTPLANGRFPAPPHDETGHTWHHPDALLERIVREGSAAVVGNGYESDMPGFGDLLTDDEIRAVLAYIKSTWPAQQRAVQARISREQGA